MSQEEVKQAIEKIISDVNSSPKAGKFEYKVETSLDEDVPCTAKVKRLQAKLRQLVIAVNRQCPVLDMLVRSVDIEKQVSINGANFAALKAL